MYGDFQCPYCTAAQPMLARVRERLGGRLRFVFRHFPIVERHPDALRAAEASEAAAAQGAFWPMHDRLFAARGELEERSLVAYASELGLDSERVAAELAGHRHATRVERDMASGRESGVTGTPAFFTNGVAHRGAFDVGSLIEALES
jgi:protein-disulfide isomerase